MNSTMLAQSARIALARRLPWLERRFREPSTYVGLATIAIDLGFPGLSAKLSMIGKDLPLILAIAGAGVAAATTSQHPPEC